MAIKLYGLKAATCTARVINILNEKNLPFELVVVDLMKGEQKAPGYLAMQPFGKVPVLEDDGFFIFESRAICKYIAKKYASQGIKLIPEDGDFKAYALFEQACSMEYSYFDGPASILTYENLYKQWKGLGDADANIVTAKADDLDSVFAAYETILSKQAYLAGNEVSLADLFHLPYGNKVKQIGFAELFTKYPAVDKWFNGLLARECWIKTNA